MSESRPAPLTLAAVFLMSAAVLILEVSLTRLFSVVLRYHFVFLVTSVAICGLGFGGLLAHVTRAWRRRWGTAGALVFGGLGFGVLAPCSLLLLLRYLLPYYPAQYGLIGGAILPPFILAGVFLSVCFESYGKQSGRLYAADLLGAAVSCIAVVGLLQWLGGLNACFASGLLAALAGAAAGPLAGGASLKLGRFACVAAALAGAAFLGANRSEDLVGVPPVHTEDPNVGKPLYRELADPTMDSKIEYTEWNAFARTDVVRETDPTTRFVYTDGHVPTNMEQWDGKLESIQPLRGFLGYLALETAPKQRALFIGPGGGLDVLMALVAGVDRIEGIEINPSIPSVMRRYRKFNGGVYEQPNVKLSVGDGRSYVRRSAAQYDLIYLALTQTATSGNVGLSLVESYIHTSDALRDYLAHLTAGGQVAFITQEYHLALRLFATAVQVLTEGDPVKEQEACRHLALVQVPPEQFAFGPYRYLLLVRKSPFTSAGAATLLEQVKLRHDLPLFIPEAHPGLPFQWVAAGEKTMAELVSDFRLPGGLPGNVAPCTDDQPFFLDLTFGVPNSLYGLCLAALILAVGLTGVLAFARRGTEGAEHLGRFTGYFALLGTGFMLAEVALAQKFILFLGYPTLTLSVVLFAVLLGGAAGSRFSQRAPVEALPEWIVGAAAAAAAMIALYALGLPVVQAPFLSAALPVRIVVSLALLFPLGFALGMPFPSGIRVLETLNRNDIPWMWGINGVTSVLGSVLAAIGAKFMGFRAVLLAGALCYLLAVVVGRRLAGEGQETHEADGEQPEQGSEQSDTGELP